MKIVYANNPLIRKVSKEVKDFDENLKNLSNSMFEEMKKEEGIGLAAIQIGEPKRILVIDIKKSDDECEEECDNDEYKVYGKFCMINPEITWKSEEKVSEEEGCLSCPGFRGDVSRPARVEIEYYDESGEKNKVKAKYLLSRCIQHEFDHLNGVLFIDYLSKLKKEIADKKIKKYLKEHEEI